MAKLYDQITDRLAEFIQAQPLFFVASAPLAADGHVNVSPKGLDCLRIISPTQVAYLDLTGSGNETSAHIQENGRITLMFCAFNGPPNILRLYGQGRTVLPDTAEWEELRPLFPEHPGARQIVAAEISRVQTSCGYAVPLMDLVGPARHAGALGRGEAAMKASTHTARRRTYVASTACRRRWPSTRHPLPNDRSPISNLTITHRIYAMTTSTWLLACASKVVTIFVAGFSPDGRKTGNNK